VVFPLLGLVGFFIYIYFYKVDILGILETVQNLDPMIYSVAVVFGLLEVLFFTASWKVLTNYLQIKMGIFRAYLYVWYGIYIDTIVPAQSISGEVTRTYLCTRDKCGPFGKVVASLFTHRLLGMALNVIALVAGIVLLTFGGNVYPLVFNALIFVAAVIVGIIGLMFVLSFKQQWTLRIIDFGTHAANKLSFGRLNLSKITGQAVEATEHFHESMVEFRHSPKAIAGSVFFLVVSWLFSLSIPYLVFLALGHPLTWSIIIVTSAIFLAVKAIPIGVPFEVGLPEAVMTTLYISMGVPGSLAATATILVRVITLWFRFFVGFASQQYLEFTPAKNLSGVTEKTKSPPVQ
jgi:glycosyltransferase 2 family protein